MRDMRENDERDEDWGGDAGAAEDADELAAFEALLRSLRALDGPCAPPVGAGSFDILYASAREIVVWFSPAKDGVAQREVAIPAALARVAWALVRRGEPVTDAALRALAPGAAGGSWLLALLAQAPGVSARVTSAGASDTSGETVPPDTPPQGDDKPDAPPAPPVVTLLWRGAGGAE